MSREFRRAMPLLPISMVMQLTDLTARQIRYYEEHEYDHASDVSIYVYYIAFLYRYLLGCR